MLSIRAHGWYNFGQTNFIYFCHHSSHYFILFSTTRLQNDWVWIAILHLRYRNSIWNNTLFMYKNVSTLPMSFTDSYTKDEPNFPQQNNLILRLFCWGKFLQKEVSGIDKVVNFKDFSRPYKKWTTFQGPKPNSRTFQDD